MKKNQTATISLEKGVRELDVMSLCLFFSVKKIYQKLMNKF